MNLRFLGQRRSLSVCYKCDVFCVSPLSLFLFYQCQTMPQSLTLQDEEELVPVFGWLETADGTFVSMTLLIR